MLTRVPQPPLNQSLKLAGWIYSSQAGVTFRLPVITEGQEKRGTWKGERIKRVLPKGQGMHFPSEEKGKDAGQTQITGVHNKCLLCAMHIQFEKKVISHLIIITFKNKKSKCVLNGYCQSSALATSLHVNPYFNSQHLHLIA